MIAKAVGTNHKSTETAAPEVETIGAKTEVVETREEQGVTEGYMDFKALLTKKGGIKLQDNKVWCRKGVGTLIYHGKCGGEQKAAGSRGDEIGDLAELAT